MSDVPRKLFFTIGLFILFPALLSGQDHRYAPVSRGALIENRHYLLDFNEEHKQPNWVYYMLTETHVSGSAPRSSSFRECRQGEAMSATNADYKGSGYDKGHLCPAADMKLSKEAMAATFQMWNMSPQEPAFNRGKWADLEALVRKYIRDETDTLFIATGPVFIGNKDAIGKGNVTVPGFYYKVIYCPERGGAGFLLPNQKIGSHLREWQVSIDLIEALTGIDFFPQLSKVRQDEIEAQTKWWE